ncbi:hypothetical protein S1OALGB6SA_1106 [Olavius algarvensis spirochete endosymbiont]|uniref:sensor histidine kinase n=1 Tax=Olavius algarvensis spirochete endosymbiont TaxID=260710 RepID=UPI00052C32BE|nr:ATP-binding protein [Olavius algarvensis spirochete endosymbiont]KGM43244.1 hypothetical protein JY97_08450 [Alkalispirochaeta odontotermitis]VDB00033.1 hypothetical protein S1OALGB6SA_1106 [Olavius algarvensis spirochete endosymbiont]
MRIPIKAVRNIHVRLTLVVTLGAALSSVLVYGILLGALFIGFGERDRAELDSRLLSYWAAWQYGGTEAVLNQASADVEEHGGRPFLLTLNGPEGELLGALIPGAWINFDLMDSELSQLSPGQYATLRSEGIHYALLATGTTFDDGSRLLVGVSTENRQFLVRMYQRYYPWAIAAIILAGFVVGIISSKRLLMPIAGLNEEIDRIIVTGELSRRLNSPGTGDSFDILISRYNRLLDRVELLISGMRDTLDAVAHELRTPLTRLRGHAEMALRKGNSGEYEEALAVVVEQTDQAVALFSAIMDIAEAEQGMLHLDIVSCNLGALVSEVCEMYEFIADEEDMSIHFEASESLELLGDPVRLRQIFGNLVDNAVKYAPLGSEIDVFCGEEGDNYWVEVIDDGPGVADGEKHRVFERFYRGDRSRASRGLGLGLSMVKALAEAHGGSISVTNAKRRGACFKVVLPKNANISI